MVNLLNYLLNRIDYLEGILVILFLELTFATLELFVILSPFLMILTSSKPYILQTHHFLEAFTLSVNLWSQHREFNGSVHSKLEELFV